MELSGTWVLQRFWSFSNSNFWQHLIWMEGLKEERLLDFYGEDSSLKSALNRSFTFILYPMRGELNWLMHKKPPFLVNELFGRGIHIQKWVRIGFRVKLGTKFCKGDLITWKNYIFHINSKKSIYLRFCPISNSNMPPIYHIILFKSLPI